MKVFFDLKVEVGVKNDFMVFNLVRLLSWLKNVVDCMDLGFGGGGKIMR